MELTATREAVRDVPARRWLALRDASAALAIGLSAANRFHAGHAERVAAYAATLGIELDLPDTDVVTLIRGGHLHDIGKAVVPVAILGKPGRLTSDEIAIVQRHTIVGDWLCRDIPALQPVRAIVRHHHERFDGRGYPDGLRGDSIPLLAQITSIADAYDALTVDRPCRTALTAHAACAELEYEAALGWRNPDLVAAFVRLSVQGRLRKLSATLVHRTSR